MKKLIPFIFIALFLVTLVGAVPPVTEAFNIQATGIQIQLASLPYYKVGTGGAGIIHVYNNTNGASLSSTTDPSVSCVAHLLNRNGSLLFDQVAVPTEDHFVITFNSTDITLPGLYPYTVHCNSTEKYETYLTGYFEANALGYEIESAQGTIVVGLIIGVLLLAWLFTFFGFKFFESDKTFPIGLLFISMALILSVYSLHIGYIASRDVLYPFAMESVQFSIYFGMMWGLIAISFFALLGLMFKTLREFRERRSINQQSDGWNDARGGKGFYSENDFSKK